MEGRKNSVARILGVLIPKKEKRQSLLNDNTTEESCHDNGILSGKKFKEGVKAYSDKTKPWSEARKEFRLAIKTLEKIPVNNLTEDDYRSFSANYYNIACCYHSEYRYGHAMENYIASINFLENVPEFTPIDNANLLDSCNRVIRVVKESGMKKDITLYISKANELNNRPKKLEGFEETTLSSDDSIDETKRDRPSM